MPRAVKTAGLALAVLLALLLGGSGAWLALRPHYRLVARPGMPVQEVRRLSTLPLTEGVAIHPDGRGWWFVYPGKPGVFRRTVDFELHGTSVRFDGCPFVSLAADRADGHTEDVEVNISPRGLTVDEMKAELAATDRMLRADGWDARLPVDAKAQDAGLRDVINLTQVTAAGGIWVGKGLELTVIVRPTFSTPVRLYAVGSFLPAAATALRSESAHVQIGLEPHCWTIGCSPGRPAEPRQFNCTAARRWAANGPALSSTHVPSRSCLGNVV